MISHFWTMGVKPGPRPFPSICYLLAVKHVCIITIFDLFLQCQSSSWLRFNLWNIVNHDNCTGVERNVNLHHLGELMRRRSSGGVDLRMNLWEKWWKWLKKPSWPYSLFDSGLKLNHIVVVSSCSNRLGSCSNRLG